MTRHPVTIVPGDTPLTHRRARAVVDRVGAGIDWQELPDGTPHEEILAAVRRTKRAWVGYRKVVPGTEPGTGSPGAQPGTPAAVRLREELGIHAQHRPIRPLPGTEGRHPDLDLLVVRETTEDVYAHLEHESIEGVFESVKVTTRAACERIARHVFETARRQGRQRVTIVHKSNILKLSDGLFLRVGRQIAQEYPDIACDEMIVDALCMRLVLDPSKYDVLLCGNLYGDILGDLCAGLVGGGSNVPTISHGPDGLVLFGSGRGDPPELDGTDRANPLPYLLPAVWLLRNLGWDGEADRLYDAIAAVLESGSQPWALGGTTGCDAFCSAVEAEISRAEPRASGA
jgi:isocitrate dehydrogenase (NAD+)